MTTRTTTLKPDPRGSYRPYIGYRKDGKQHRFNLGKDRSEANRRAERIRQVYQESVAIRENYKRQKPSWTQAALHAAEWIAKGLSQIPLPTPHVVHEAVGECLVLPEYDAEWTGDEPWALLWTHAVASRHYRSVNWILPEGRTRQEVIDLSESLFETQAARHARLLRSKEPLAAIVGSFHDALDAYSRYVDGLKAISPPTKAQRQSQIKQLKLQHEDRPLAMLTLAECRSLFGFWTNSPAKLDGTGTYSRSACKHRCSELSMFFGWLHLDDEFTWRKPEDYDTIKKTISKNSGKSRSIRDIITKSLFSVEELATINRFCDPLDRLLLYLGLNCCFGAAESGRLELDDLFLNQRNPIEHVWKKYGFSSSPDDSWIAYLRPKTSVAGCWWLFPETVTAFQRYGEVSPESSTNRIVVSKQGTSLYKDHARNGQSLFTNRWNRLFDRIRSKHPDFTRHPFGTLRDQFSDWLVYHGESESGSIALTHGTPYQDDLLACYANRPFPRLFDLQKKYRKELQPVFAAEA